MLGAKVPRLVVSARILLQTLWHLCTTLAIQTWGMSCGMTSQAPAIAQAGVAHPLSLATPKVCSRCVHAELRAEHPVSLETP